MDKPTAVMSNSTADPAILGSILNIQRILLIFNNYHAVVSVILVIIVIVTNLVTLVCVRKYEFLRKQRYVMVTSLSVANIIGGVNLLVILGYFRVHVGECIPTIDIFTVQSVYSFPNYINYIHMAFIGLDKFIAITFPLRYPSLMSKRAMTAVISFCWVVPFLYISASFTWLIGQPDIFCFSSMIAVNFFITIPLVIMCIIVLLVFALYGRVLLIAARQTKKIHEFVNNTNNATAAPEKIPAGTKMIIVLLGSFVVLNMPYMVMTIMIYNQSPGFVVWISGSVAQECILAMSFVNNIIYAAFSNDFRSAYRRLMFSCRVVPMA